MTQQARVLQYLQHHGSITSMDAFTDLGVTSLSRRICDLKQQGHNIKVERVAGQNRFGEKVSYNKYLLEQEAQQ